MKLCGKFTFLPIIIGTPCSSKCSQIANPKDPISEPDETFKMQDGTFTRISRTYPTSVEPIQVLLPLKFAGLSPKDIKQS